MSHPRLAPFAHLPAVWTDADAEDVLCPACACYWHERGSLTRTVPHPSATPPERYCDGVTGYLDGYPYLCPFYWNGQAWELRLGDVWRCFREDVAEIHAKRMRALAR